MWLSALRNGLSSLRHFIKLCWEPGFLHPSKSGNSKHRSNAAHTHRFCPTHLCAKPTHSRNLKLFKKYTRQTLRSLHAITSVESHWLLVAIPESGHFLPCWAFRMNILAKQITLFESSACWHLRLLCAASRSDISEKEITSPCSRPKRSATCAKLLVFMSPRFLCREA